MKHHLVTVLVLAAALLAYAFGLDRGVVAIVMLGFALEGWFWLRVTRSRRPPPKPPA